MSSMAEDLVQTALKSELDQKLQKGSVALHNKQDGALFTGTQKIGGRKNKKARGETEANSGAHGQVEFSIIKKFNNLKTTVPMKDDEYKPTIEGLGQLKDALLYWGKIIQRQSKIKFIRSARKISSDPEYKDAAAKEE